MKIKIYADGSDIKLIQKIKNNHLCKGFTTNPTLMRSAGVKDFMKFITLTAKKVYPKPISFECISDNLDEIYNQSLIINSVNKNVYVKIPITNTKGHYSTKIIKELWSKRVKMNITAIFTEKQAKRVINSLDPKISNKIVISVFAGRIADTGRDPKIIMSKIREYINKNVNKKKIELLWASPREIYNIYEAEKLGVDIITVPYAFFEKLKLKNKNLESFSIETVKMFYNDAVASKYTIKN